MICCEQKVEWQFPSTRHVDENRTSHEDEVCMICWNTHLQTQIEDKATDQIRCAQCNVQLDEPEIRMLANQATYNR